ncbi:hypothetical protein WJX82_009140 [Trebouxia sp. C0006]
MQAKAVPCLWWALPGLWFPHIAGVHPLPEADDVDGRAVARYCAAAVCCGHPRDHQCDVLHAVSSNLCSSLYQGVSSTWNDSRVVWLSVVPKSTADSASCDQDSAPLDVNVLVVTERGIAKRLPLGEVPGQSKGHRGMKAITLGVGGLNSLAAMHAFTFQGAKPADSECIVALSSKGNATKRLVTTAPVFGQHYAIMFYGCRKGKRLLKSSVLAKTV